jgi:hypothetical protein
MRGGPLDLPSLANVKPMPTRRRIDTPDCFHRITIDETLLPEERLRLIEALFVHDVVGDRWADSRHGLASEMAPVRTRGSTRPHHAGRPGRERADRSANGR